MYISPQKDEFYVYSLSDGPYNPFYIGKGKGKRAFDHVGEARRGSHLPVHKKIRSMGKDPDVKILTSGLSEADAYELEELAILTAGRRCLKNGPLLNLSCGGRGGTSGHSIILTPEQDAKKNAALRSPEVRAKISKGVKASDRKLTEKGRLSIQATHRGKILSPETKAKISAAKQGQPGHPHTKESKAKISESNRRRHVSDETKQKISESVKRTGMTDEQKIKQRKAVLCLVTCPHCDKEGARSIMMRWHFDNCRYRDGS